MVQVKRYWVFFGESYECTEIGLDDLNATYDTIEELQAYVKTFMEGELESEQWVMIWDVETMKRILDMYVTYDFKDKKEVVTVVEDKLKLTMRF